MCIRDSFWRNNIFEYYCLPFESSKYSIQNQYVDYINSTFQKVVSQKFDCPWQAVCTTRGVQSKGNFWGYLGNISHKEITFFSCPSFYCCSQIESCQSFNTCRNGRVSRFCGRCPPNHSMSLFNQYSCIDNTNGGCSNLFYWIILVALLSVVMVITMAYSDKTFLIFDYLQQQQNMIITSMKGYRKMKDHDDVHSNCVSQLTPGTKVLCDSKTNRNEVISDNNEDINDKANRNSQTIDIANAEHNNSSEAQHLTSVYGSIGSSDHNNSNEAPHFDDDELQLCLTNESPTEPFKLRSSWRGMMVIQFYFYPIVGLLLTNNSVSSNSGKLIPAEIISSFFTIKLQTPSIKFDGCLVENTRGMFMVEFMKTSVLYMSLVIVLITMLVGFIHRKSITKRNNEAVHPQHDEDHVDKDWDQVLKETDSQPSIELRMKTSYMRLLCYGYTTTTVLLLNYVHCISIGEVSYMFLDASIQCSTNSNTYIASVVLLLLWCIMFIPALYFGCRLLGRYRITVNQFLLLLTVPPLVIGFLILINQRNYELRLQEKDAFEIRFIFKSICKPYRKKLMGRECGECIYLVRSFLLSMACILPNDWQTRLFYSGSILLFFLFLHRQTQPFKMARLNTIESCCVVCLLLMDFLIFIMNSHLKKSVIENATDVFVVLSFTPFIVYILFVVYDVIVRIYFLVLKIVAVKRMS